MHSIGQTRPMQYNHAHSSRSNCAQTNDGVIDATTRLSTKFQKAEKLCRICVKT